MNTPPKESLKLLSRNEGKIKSYESCTDTRAWSHDSGTKGKHLRDWMRANMTVSALPFHPIIKVFTEITCRSRRKTAPQCHRDCKSKVLIDSISTSCDAMKQCFKNDEQFEKYFQDEGFETSHWPCERCLDALKGVKMLWKIIMDKIFNTTVPEKDINICEEDNIKSIAVNWQKEIQVQVDFIKQISESKLHKKDFRIKNELRVSKSFVVKRDDVPIEVKRVQNRTILCDRYSETSHIRPTQKSHCLTTEFDSESPLSCRSHKKPSKSVAARVPAVDAACDPCDLIYELKKLDSVTDKLQHLQEKYNNQVNQLEILKKENFEMKTELENNRNDMAYLSNNLNLDSVVFELAPKMNKDTSLSHNIHSGTIISMKELKHSSFKHVTLLEVLHKSNEPMTRNFGIENNNLKEDPITVLNTVQNKFRAMVRKEVKIVTKEAKRVNKQSEINAYYETFSNSTSTLSCTTLSANSLTNFKSATEV